MPDSKRLTTLKRLTDFLQREITPDNGYQHDLTDAVRRGRKVYGGKGDPLPMVAINDSPNPDNSPGRAGDRDDAHAPTQRDRWLLLVQGWAKDDKDNPTDPAYNLLADVQKALGKLKVGGNVALGIEQHPDYLLDGLINDLEVEPGVVPPMEDSSTYAQFYMRLWLDFSEDLDDPYDLGL